MSTLYFLGNASPVQMFGCVIRTETKTVVIDGGMGADGPQLADLLKNISDCHVDAWFLTHPHYDHYGALLDIYHSRPEIRVDKLYAHFPPLSMMEEYDPTNPYEISRVKEFADTDLFRSIHTVEKGEIYSFDDLCIHVLRVFNPEILSNFVNNSSTVYRLDTPNTRVLILGDLGVEGGEEVMREYPPESLYADYTQLAHHGQCGVSKEFYQYIKPKKCLWASPDWLWDNNAGNGFDTGPWQTVRTREWMEELGVTEHIVEKDGMAILSL